MERTWLVFLAFSFSPSRERALVRSHHDWMEKATAFPSSPGRTTAEESKEHDGEPGQTRPCPFVIHLECRLFPSLLVPEVVRLLFPEVVRLARDNFCPHYLRILDRIGVPHCTIRWTMMIMCRYATVDLRNPVRWKVHGLCSWLSLFPPRVNGPW